jgi:hypothetical protein
LPVSLSPVINCSPVSTTPGKNCIDDRGLLLLQNYLRPPKSATAADIVIGRPRRPPKLLQTKTALFSFGGLRGL